MTSFNNSPHKQRTTIKELLQNFVHVCIGFLCLIPVGSFILFVQAPIFLYRLLVTKLFAPFFRPKLGSAVTANGQFMAAEFLEEYAKKASRYTVLVTIILKGTLTVTELRELLLTRWIQAKSVRDGTSRYPEFQQYIESWMGFMFWKQEENFDLDDHIIGHDRDKHVQQQYSEAYLTRLYEKLLNEPFIRFRSPWEVHLIENYKTSELKNNDLTAVMFRFHHVFADGFAAVHMLIEVLFGCKFENVQMQVPIQSWQRQRSGAGKGIAALSLPFQFVRDFGYIVTIGCNKQQIWKRQKSTNGDMETGGLSKSLGKTIVVKSHWISVEKLKTIKNRFGVTFSSALLSSLSASLSKNFQAGIPVIKENYVRLSMMLPAAGRTKELSHNEHCTIFCIDLRPQIDCEERLLETERRLNKTKASFVPNIIFTVMKAFSGSLATPFASIVDSNQCMPVCTSNFRGPAMPFGLDNKWETFSMDAVVGAYSDIMTTMYSYNGNLRIALTTMDDILDRMQLEKLLKDFCDEIEILYKLRKGK